MEQLIANAFEENEISSGLIRVVPPKVYRTAIVIPAHNEEAVLSDLLDTLLAGIASNSEVQLIVSENGSSDRTLKIALEYSSQFPQIVVVTDTRASYGLALQNGIRAARADYVVLINADLWSESFFLGALRQFESGSDIVVGSKRLNPKLDQRPLVRRLITQSFNRFLRHAFGFRGTDTHGLKALRLSTVRPLVEKCITNREIFDTELLLRAQYAGLQILEVPLAVVDTRPARLSLLRRVGPTIKDLVVVFRSLRLARTATNFENDSIATNRLDAVNHAPSREAASCSNAGSLQGGDVLSGH